MVPESECTPPLVSKTDIVQDSELVPATSHSHIVGAWHIGCMIYVLLLISYI
jgi:hypothetical protein